MAYSNPYSNIYGSDDVGKILRQAKQLQAHGESLSKNAIRGAVRGALESRAARMKDYAELSLRERALTDEKTYKRDYLSEMSKEAKMRNKSSALSGYMQLGGLGLGAYSVFKPAAKAASTMTFPTTPMVTPSATYAGTANLPAGVSPSAFTGAQATGATKVGVAGVAPETSLYGAFTPSAQTTEFGAGLGAGAGAGGAGAGIGSTVAHEVAFAEGSAATAGTGIGAGAGAGVGAATAIGSGLVGGFIGQRATGAGEPGHMGGERTTGRAIGAVTSAATAFVLSGGNPIVTIMAAITGAFTGGGGDKG